MSFTRNNLKSRVQKANLNNISRLTDSFNGLQQNQLNAQYNKFTKSRKQCDIEIDDHLKLLTDYRFRMEDMKKDKLKQTLRNFQNHYDKYMNQILKDVRDILENQKKRLMQTIMADREKELMNEKEIKRRIDEQIAEIKQMKKGLGTENYKEYIAKVVIYDFSYETKKIKQAMDRLSYDDIHLRVDEKRKDCYRNDLQRAIICEEYDVRNQDDKAEVNLHQNRDMIKKSKWG